MSHGGICERSRDPQQQKGRNETIRSTKREGAGRGSPEDEEAQKKITYLYIHAAYEAIQQ